jgi:hypothetical protein
MGVDAIPLLNENLTISDKDSERELARKRLRESACTKKSEIGYVNRSFLTPNGSPGSFHLPYEAMLST